MSPTARNNEKKPEDNLRSGSSEGGTSSRLHTKGNHGYNRNRRRPPQMSRAAEVAAAIVAGLASQEQERFYPGRRQQNQKFGWKRSRATERSANFARGNGGSSYRPSAIPAASSSSTIAEDPVSKASTIPDLQHYTKEQLEELRLQLEKLGIALPVNTEETNRKEREDTRMDTQ